MTSEEAFLQSRGDIEESDPAVTESASTLAHAPRWPPKKLLNLQLTKWKMGFLTGRGYTSWPDGSDAGGTVKKRKESDDDDSSDEDSDDDSNSSSSDTYSWTDTLTIITIIGMQPHYQYMLQGF
ncbi:hypothetical protein AX15_000458 [Amanita polypyramis BW_CC]|nr:hypothetical protein AX15_000458 [Amanita polypyramis BW_CC]